MNLSCELTTRLLFNRFVQLIMCKSGIKIFEGSQFFDQMVRVAKIIYYCTVHIILSKKVSWSNFYWFGTAFKFYFLISLLTVTGIIICITFVQYICRCKLKYKQAKRFFLGFWKQTKRVVKIPPSFSNKTLSNLWSSAKWNSFTNVISN